MDIIFPFCSYFIGNHIDHIDKKIQSIRLPKIIRRNLKPISERDHYHAHEWKYFLLFIAYPLFKDILPGRYLDHMAKLIDSVHILCSETIEFDRLAEADRLLSLFVEEHEILFGEVNMVFNVHLLNHLCDCVRYIGPLPCYSNYCFEDFIGHLVAFQKGTTDVSKQISLRYILEKKLLQHLQKSSLALEFYKDIVYKMNFRSAKRLENSVLAREMQTLSPEIKSSIKNCLQLSEDDPIKEYQSVLLNGKIFYEAARNKSFKRTDDSFIYNASSGKFAVIRSIFVVSEKLFFLIDECFETERHQNNICNSIIYLKLLNHFEQKIIRAPSVGPKYVFMKFGNEKVCSKFPNLYERD